MNSKLRTPNAKLGAPASESGAKAWHHLGADDALRLLEVDPKIGLADEEVRRRLKKFGPNRIEARGGTPAWQRLLHEFNQPLVYLLVAAAIVTGFVGEWVDCGVIATVVLINAIVGFFQETRAEHAIESLARMVSTVATVRRNGRTMRVQSEMLVPGDVVLFQAGARVPADLRLLHERGLQVDESALTGESVPVHKHSDPLAIDTLLADRRNLLFAGTLVTAGQGEAVAWATGDRTETGRIARLVSEAVEMSTPLTRKIAQFSRLIIWVVLGLAAVTFLLGVARDETMVEMFMAAVALSVGAIPEGLPAAMTIVLAIGVARMAKRRAIIRKLPAVETLGSTTVICADKTGTLTENQMTVREIHAGGELFEVTGNGYEAKGEIRAGGTVVRPGEHPALLECLRAGVLCNDAQLVRDDAGRIEVEGDPTEAALLVAAAKGGLLHAPTHREWPRLDMIPFESGHMYRATLHRRQDSGVVYQAGAAERLIARCVDTLDERGERVRLDPEALHATVAEMAARGLRVLGFGRLHVDAQHAQLEHKHVAGGLTFLGLQGMIDPPRREAIAAVRNCQRAGILVKMITGDHLATARSVAEQIGLKVHGDEPLEALSGRELEKISDADLPLIAERTVVFARVAPEQKFRLVQALQARGHIVAMTGDGVNDAPALKQADIGIAMGISGTDVAKSAAAMVLTDDNFASIEAAVEEGRGVFDNLNKFIVWIIPTNLGESLVLLIAIVIGLPLPLLPLQLLWINFTDTLLGLPLAFEPRERDIMRRPPRDPQQPLLTRALLLRTALVCGIMLAGAFWLYFWQLKAPGENLAAARTTVVNVIVLVEAVYLFNCRSLHRPVFAIGIFSSGWALIGAATMITAQMLFTYVPLMNRLFHSAPIGLDAWWRIAVVTALVFLVVELEKWLRTIRARRAPLRTQRA